MVLNSASLRQRSIGGRRIAKARYATFAVARGRGHATEGQGAAGAGDRAGRGTPRRGGAPGRGAKCRAASRGAERAEGWRARCRKTRRGCRMRRRGNTRRRAIPHMCGVRMPWEQGNGSPIRTKLFQDPSPAAVAAAGRGHAAPISNPTTTCASAPATTAARAFSILITT